MARLTTEGAISEVLKRVFADEGLTDSEIRAYEFLRRAGSATPSQIARETGQARGRVYETMRRLVERSFAREEPTKPIRYAPTPLAEVVSLMAGRISQQTQTLREIQSWVREHKPEPEAPQQHPLRPGDVAVASGRRACMTELRRLMRESREWLLLAFGAPFGRRFVMLEGIQTELESLRQKRIPVRLLAPWGELGEAATRVLDRVAQPDGKVTLPTALNRPLAVAANETAVLEILSQPDDDSPNRGDDVGIRISNPLYALLRVEHLSATLGPGLGDGFPHPKRGT